MAVAATSSSEQFCVLLEQDRTRFDELAVALTVAESYFFREAPQMELLTHHVLPERAEARGPEHTLRLWSAGCAHGQEAYTLAILLDEAGLGKQSHILATDLSAQALETARRGLYGKWSLRTVDDRRRRTYFRSAQGGFRVDPRLDRLVTFRQHNLLEPSDDPRMRDLDVVLCRNVLVYLTPAAVEQVGCRLAASLAPGGWLLTAATDPHLDAVEGLEALVTPAGVAYRRPVHAVRGASRASERKTRPRSRPDRHAVGDRPMAHRPPRPPAHATAPAAPGAPPYAAGGADRDQLGPAREALLGGDYETAAAHAGALVASGSSGISGSSGTGGEDAAAEAHVVLVRALGSAGRLGAAVEAAAAGAARFPLDVELRLLQAIVLLEAGLPLEAAAAAKATLYIDPDLAVAHLALARAHQARNDRTAARRSYRNALSLLEGLPVGQPVKLADGETAGRLAGLARAGQGATAGAARS
ncbi:MAG TPA: protein-glutamate O-methyltransferase CheR [Acidimicrobiales bacterium]|nr:protein-glutamate O-methyltransferase CheR [Acidimicrobiales bacterium]